MITNGKAESNGAAAGRGWFQVPNSLIDEFARHLGPGAVVVYLCLIRQADRSGTCYPSLAGIAHRLGMSRRNIIRHIQTLREVALITVEVRNTLGNRASNLYSVHPIPEPGTSDFSALVTKLHQCQKRRATSDKNDARLVTERHLEGYPLNKTHRTRPPLPPKGGSAGFERFWKTYPKKKRKDLAQKEWEKLAPDDGLQQMMFDALKRQKRSTDWHREEGRFIPKPHLWLSGHEWEGFAADADSKSAPDTDDRRIAREMQEERERIESGQTAGPSKLRTARAKGAKS
ncbi:MAG TPA: helix-turn-helix domain-containing protein [Gemmataceae bacterium]|nr:helix-turn-helix domain-containing protein [Gemmataceae bacterium]